MSDYNLPHMRSGASRSIALTVLTIRSDTFNSLAGSACEIFLLGKFAELDSQFRPAWVKLQSDIMGFCELLHDETIGRHQGCTMQL